tara:strand:+ start:1292 stop:1450 length:159 start_codon:yes stop_codon:yes gene_type:complete
MKGYLKVNHRNKKIGYLQVQYYIIIELIHIKILITAKLKQLKLDFEIKGKEK